VKWNLLKRNKPKWEKYDNECLREACKREKKRMKIKNEKEKKEKEIENILKKNEENQTRILASAPSAALLLAQRALVQANTAIDDHDDTI
jgi:superfamily II DNA or RNA helicase